MADKHNSFNDKSKIGIITAIYPDKKTVDIKYESQAGTYLNINLPYTIIGLTWGIMFMPVKGDKVVLDMSQGDRPVIKSMHPVNVNLLPYLDPGEMLVMSENGSYLHLKTQRKRSISTDGLLDYDATQGPKGPTDIQYEPSGIVLRVRTKQNRDQVAPRWNLHSSLAMFDNGDVNLESMHKGKPKALLHMNGTTGFVFLSAGDGQIQEYIEMNPLKKEMLFFTDGEEHHHVQTNKKENIYKNVIHNIGGGLQMMVGLNLANIPGDFDKILADKVGPGDIYISNQATQGVGKATIHLKSDLDVITDYGDVNITVSQGKMVIIVKGDINLTTQGNLNATVSGNSTVNTNGTTTVESQTGIHFNSAGDVVINSANFELNVSGHSQFNHRSSSLVESSVFNRHIHHDGPPGSTSTPDPIQGDDSFYG